MRFQSRALVAAGLAAILNSSCAVQQHSSAEPSGALIQKRTKLDVQSAVMKMADDYSIALAEAMRPIITNEDLDPAARQLARAVQRNGMGSAIDIAVGPNPDAALLDMLVLISLQRWSVAEHGVANGIPEPQTRKVVEQLELAEAAAWESSSSVLSDAQKQTLRSLINAWIEANPDRFMVAFVRFVEFVDSRHQPSSANRSAAKGLLKEVTEATESIESARLLGERALWYAGRYPFVLGQQVEWTASQVSNLPDVRTAIESLESLRQLTHSLAARADSLERDLTTQQELLIAKVSAERVAAIDQAKIAIADVVRAALDDLDVRIARAREAAVAQAFDRLVSERKSFVADLESKEGVLRDLVTDLQTTIGASGSLAKELTGTVNALDRVVARFDPETRADGKALDMKDVRDAAVEARNAAEKLTILLEKTNELAGSDIWDQRLARLDHATSGLIDRAFWRGLWLVLALLAGLALLRFLPRRATDSKASRAG